MDGKDLFRRLRELLNEELTGGWMDDRTSYDFLYEASKEFNDRTNSLTSYQDITTVADQPNYALNANFSKLYLKKDNRYYVRYYDQINYTFMYWKDYQDILYDNNILAADAAEVPGYFCIRDKQSLYSQITGTATSSGAKSGGQCTLTDTSGLFTTTDYVSPGDIIHNTSDGTSGSSGVVLSITSATALVCALFGGTNNQWASSDAYVIQPQGRLELYLDPPPDDASDTVRVWYIAKPDPVYSDYGVYRFRDNAMESIVKYAAWLYKYRDSEPNFGDSFFQWWDRSVRREIANMNPHGNRRRVEISFKKRT